MKKATLLFFVMIISTVSLASNASAVSISFHDLRLCAWTGLNPWAGPATSDREALFSTTNSIVDDYKGTTEKELAENERPECFQIAGDADITQGNVGLDPIEIDTTTPEGPAPVPEPASMVLLGLGILGVAAIRRAETRNRG